MIDFLGLTIYPYGLAVAGAAVIALLLAASNFRKVRLDVNVLSWFAPLAIVLGLLGARVGFCLAAWDYVAQDGLGFIFEFTRGGFMLYGALAGCVLALVIACRLCKACLACAADALAAPAMVMIALCRLAEGLVEQGYGWGIAEYSTPEKLFRSEFCDKVYEREPEESYQRLFDHLRSLFPAVDEKLIRKILK